MGSIKIDKRQAIRMLWNQGNLRFKLDRNQLEMYEFINKTQEKIVVIASSRRIGKTYFLITLAIDFSLRNPNTIVKFISPTVKMLRTNINPLMREILQDAPKEVLPIYNSKDNVYKFKNGSEIQLAGTDNGNADSIRGGSAHLCILDEVGFIDDLDYVVNSVLLPTTTTTRGKIIMASTPPKSPDHPFSGFMQRAEQAGTFIKKTIYDNPRLSKEDIKIIADSVGGVDSVDFKREYLVENVVSEDDAVVPEFTKELREKVIQSVSRPPLADCYVSMDIGGADLTVVLFGFYDFLSAKLVIQDELVFNRKVLSDEIAYAVKAKELELWGDGTGYVKPPYLRVADNNNIILLNDLGVKHGMYFMPTLKDNKIAELNNMRMMLKQERIIIDPKCRVLISHLQGATWNKARTSYTRSADKGHFDMCFTPGNKVLTRNGYKPIEEIKVGDEVLTHKNRFRKVLNTMNRQYDGELKEIKLSGQFKTTCTPEHAFYAAKTHRYTGEQFTGQAMLNPLEWIPASDLEAHRVYSPSIEEETYDITNELCFLYGYYVAEGSCGGNGYQISFAGHSREVNVVEIIEKAVVGTYGDGKAGTSKKSLYRHKNNITKPRKRKARIYNRKASNGRILNITCFELRAELLKLGKGSNKKFPDFISRLNKEQALYMLSGYLFGDGHFSKAGQVSNTISRNVTDGLDILYRKLGIIMNTRTYINDNDNPAFSSSLTKNDTRILLEMIESRSDLKFTFEDKKIHDSNPKNFRHYDTKAIRVQSVKTILDYSGLVYNLEVEEDNSYVVNGASAHNCDALVYLSRNLNTNKNPYPAGHGFNGNDYIVIREPSQASTYETFLVNKIKSRNPFRRRG